MSKNNGNSNQSIIQDFWKTYDWIEKLKNVPEPRIYNGWIVEGGQNVIFTEAGAGKSVLAFANAWDIYKKEGIPFVYVDIDNPIVLPKARGLIDYIDGTENIYINQAHLEDIINSELARELKINRYKNIGIRLLKFLDATIDYKAIVVLDSLQKFVDTNELAEVRPFFELLDKLTHKFTFIIIHHTNKENRYKGLSFIRDTVDSMYYIKSTDKNEKGYIKKHTIVADKQRFLTETEITFKYDLFDIEEVLFGVGLTKEEEIILRTAVSIIRKSDTDLIQSELVKAIKEKVSIGEKKIRRTLQDFVEKGLFILQTGGLTNKHIYKVNEESPYLSLLFDNDLSEVKKELLNTVKELEELPEEIEIRDDTGSIRIYQAPEAIKNNIWKMKDEEAREILNKLKGNTVNSELNSDLEALVDSEDNDDYVPF